MPPGRRIPEVTSQTGADEKIARLLALFIVRDLKQPAEKIRALKAAGFSVSGMAPILDMTENAINVSLHRARKKDGSAENKATKKRLAATKREGK